MIADSYREFLEAKVAVDRGTGYECDPSEVHPLLKPHQAAMVAWCVQGGRRALFASFGLGKTLCELETARLTLEKSGGKRALIVMPLGVRQEFLRDAAMIGTPVRFVKSTASVEATFEGIFLTNYESVRDGKIDLSLFDVLVLDEGAVLRSFGSKTFGELLFGPAMKVPHRFVCTATPSPNSLLELIAYAHFLGAMDMGESKTRFFKRNSEKADDLTIHPHKEEEFWHWVKSWGLFVDRPSVLGFSDEGYELPPLEIVWHKLPSDHRDAGTTKRGQGLMFKDAAAGVVESSKEKRSSLDARVAKAVEIRSESPNDHFVWWHDQEAERRAIEKAWPGVVAVYGSQKDEEKEAAVVGFSDGEISDLAGKPVMLGAGVNFQRHCHRAIYVGIGYKFADFIQSVHRLQRFLQPRAVRIDLIYTEAEEGIRRDLEEKWAQHRALVENMTRIVREFGLAAGGASPSLQRAMEAPRREISGASWRLVNCDSVEEARRAPSDSFGLILSSYPFSTQYEYTPSFRDFGHTDSAEHFWEQMDFLTPELHRVLMPGRKLVIHVKDRVVPGDLIGQSYQSVDPFHADAIVHCRRHGFTYLGMVTIGTDVVRENNQTYRLSWSEQCKDASRMGVGMPEYLLLFRKNPTDAASGYADVPVAKTKEGYPLARWQLDANGFWRSSGDRLLSIEEFAALSWKEIYGIFREANAGSVYDHGLHVRIQQALEDAGKLPRDFALIPPHSADPAIWTDVMRARTLNCQQSAKGREKHLCPLPIDIVDRAIELWTNPGETVLDPFSGLATVPSRAVALGRHGEGWELNAGYWADGGIYCRAAEEKRWVPTLFGLEDIDALKEAA